MKNKYLFAENKKITAQFVLNNILWIAFEGIDGICNLKGCSVYDLDTIYWDIDKTANKINSIISIDNYIYLALDDDTNICAEFDSSNPSDFWYLAKDVGVTEEAIDVVFDSVSNQVYFLSPGIESGENAKISVYDWNDNYIETIDLTTVFNASKISADEDGFLWVLSDLDDAPMITKVWYGSSWHYTSYWFGIFKIFGGLGVNVIPESIINKIFVREGNLSIQFIIESLYGEHNIWEILGNLLINLIPESIINKEVIKIGDLDVSLILESIINRIITWIGSLIINLSPESLYELVPAESGGGYTEDLIPTMTSNTAPSGVASASAVYSTYLAWNAMDDSIANIFGWINVFMPRWLQYQFTSGKTIRRYTITSANQAPPFTYSPVAWTLRGSNNGTDWTTLDTQTNQSFAQNEKKTYDFSNSTSYVYYRLNITVSSGEGQYVSISEWELMEYV